MMSEMLGILRLRSVLRKLISGALEYSVPRVSPHVIRILPHDKTAFTQGLAYHDGRLFESTGLVGRSSLRELDPEDGHLIRLLCVAGHHAEGIAVLANRLYQLTWKSQKALLYDIHSLERIGEIGYRGEGWGLAAGPDSLLKSDGTSILEFHGDDFQIRRRLRATSNGIPLRHINDIEWVGSYVYANVLNSNSIFELLTSTGKLNRIIDCAGLVSIEKPGDRDQVLNGIAFNDRAGTFFLTGKYWHSLFEVSFPA